jgi:hypothetical protein
VLVQFLIGTDRIRKDEFISPLISKTASVVATRCRHQAHSRSPAGSATAGLAFVEVSSFDTESVFMKPVDKVSRVYSQITL